MSNNKPVTCAEVGHCLNPDGDDTCMRCGAVDGWIPHTGNECPVPGETVVAIKTKFDPSGDSQHYAGAWNWDAEQNPITHYRIVTPVQNHPAAGLDPAVVGVKAFKVEPSYETKLWDQATIAFMNRGLEYNDALDEADAFMTERAKRMAARKAGG